MRRADEAAAEAAAIPVVPWAEFCSLFRWEQGQHVSAIGPTGLGKTTLVMELVHARADLSPSWHTVVLHTKPDKLGPARRGQARTSDRTLIPLARRPEWHYLRSWDLPYAAQRVILHPRWRNRHDDAHQRDVIRAALDDIWSRGYWAVIADDLAHLCRKLRLEDDLKDYWQLGRAPGISLVSNVQRPAWVPLDLYSQATHLFFWRTNDDNDLRRIGGLNGVASATVRQAVSTLPKHQALYVNTDTGDMMRTTANQEVTL